MSFFLRTLNSIYLFPLRVCVRVCVCSFLPPISTISGAVNIICLFIYFWKENKTISRLSICLLQNLPFSKHIKIEIKLHGHIMILYSSHFKLYIILFIILSSLFAVFASIHFVCKITFSIRCRNVHLQHGSVSVIYSQINKISIRFHLVFYRITIATTKTMK